MWKGRTEFRRRRWEGNDPKASGGILYVADGRDGKVK